MNYQGLTLAALLLLTFSISSASDDIFHNQFAVEIDAQSDPHAIAQELGLVNLGQIGSLAHHYLFEHPKLHKRSTQKSAHHDNLMKNHAKIKWFAQQTQLKRSKRGLEADSDDIFIPDPLFEQQWFLNHGAVDGSDMNVLGAWERGYTGKNVVVTILDDGIQVNHPDLAQNYDRLASIDINGKDDDPTPRDDGNNKHGTRCAGEVAAVAFNEYCGVGIAYNASIGGKKFNNRRLTFL